MYKKMDHIINHFDIKFHAQEYGGGNINDSYRVTPVCKYMLQKVNTNVFQNIDYVMDNVQAVTAHIRKKLLASRRSPETGTLHYLMSDQGKRYYRDENGDVYRMFRFIDNSFSYDVADDPEILYEAAKLFGDFQNMLADFPVDQLYEVIPDFHNTKVRFENFKKALAENKSGRADQCQNEIDFVMARDGDVGVIVDALASGEIPLRVTHNDTKLNNTLFDIDTNKGLCVIDLDTVMPGSLLYDFGDALRVGGSSAAEDEKDTNMIWLVEENFEYFTRGFIEELPNITERELELLPFSVKLMSLECGMRFLTDYLDGDTYFKTSYPEHNIVRARAQFKLVRDIEAKMDKLGEIVRRVYEEVKSK